MPLGEVSLELDGLAHVIDCVREQRSIRLVARARHLVLPEPRVREADVCEPIPGVQNDGALEIGDRAWNERCVERLQPDTPFGERLVRLQAAQWKIDPRKIGVLGFSAGGHLVAATSTHFEKRLYPAVDAADNESCRPDFAVALYPGHLAVRENDFALNPDIRVTSRTPPTFLLQAEDDPVDPVENSLVYYSALRKAGVLAEMHLYVKGGHAFALRPTESPITRWPQLVETWLQTIGMISP